MNHFNCGTISQFEDDVLKLSTALAESELAATEAAHLSGSENGTKIGTDIFSPLAAVPASAAGLTQNASEEVGKSTRSGASASCDTKSTDGAAEQPDDLLMATSRTASAAKTCLSKGIDMYLANKTKDRAFTKKLITAILVSVFKHIPARDARRNDLLDELNRQVQSSPGVLANRRGG